MLKNGYKPDQDDIVEKRKKQIIRRNRILKIADGVMIFILCIYMIIGTAGITLVRKLTDDIPSLDLSRLKSEESTIIYDGDDNVITEVGTYYRQNITYEDCPESLVDAFLAIEDSRYFTHNGFDIPRFSKSIINTFVHGDMQGGSTFTMQLVKNSYFSIEDGQQSTERKATIRYKVQQILLSMELETKMDKKEIFALYINKVNFGDRIRGVQKAAQYYFGKNVSDLSLSESAMLAGIVNLPNRYNPYYYLDYATTRRNQVLSLMVTHGYISQQEYDLASSIRVEDLLSGGKNMNTENMQFAEYTDVVLQEALALTGKDPVLHGMEIHTALNRTVQNTIESIEDGSYGISFSNDTMQTAIISIDNTNGEIIGIGGGRNYNGGAMLLNRATSMYKQPGSTIKPVLSYALAFEYLGYSLDEILMDRPISFPAEERVLVNANGKYAGEVTLKDAVAKSLNIPAILTLEKVTSKIGGQAVVDYMHSIGLSTASNENFHMSYAIGGNLLEATVLEMAGAHAAIINHGVYNKPHTIRRIVTSSGQEYSPDGLNVQVLSSGSAWLTAQLMKNNVDVGNQLYNYMGVLQKDYPVYAKTGTTDWGEDGLQYGIPVGVMKDKWMIASTSNYTNAVWLGWDKAVAGGYTYFTSWMDQQNITGQINLALINAQETIPTASVAGVPRPDDVTDVTYQKGTWPHVTSTSSYNSITSQVSVTGLSNMPSIDSTNALQSLSASVYNNILYITWGGKKGCGGGSIDISLKDGNRIRESAYGACLANTYSAYPYNTKYYADVYIDDALYYSVTSDDGTYNGYSQMPEGSTIKVCGWIRKNGKVTNTQCVTAGEF
ncbi:MAG: transglycosylase domain-containing protein [Bulleidia sp.]|nr:transglycosylase domain-containing protein [Bulleidia sp.]